MTDLQSCLNLARMSHSMITVEEKNLILLVGGEDQNMNLLSDCEAYSLSKNKWITINPLNQQGKNLSLCKFEKGRMD